MAGKEAYTVEQIVKEVKGSGGFVTEISRRLHCTRATVYKYKKKYKEVAEAIFEEKEHLLDGAESQLLKKIKGGNLTAIIFYLKTQGYPRGYGDRSKLDFVDKTNKALEKKVKDDKESAQHVKKVIEELEKLKLVPNDAETKS